MFTRVSKSVLKSQTWKAVNSKSIQIVTANTKSFHSAVCKFVQFELRSGRRVNNRSLFFKFYSEYPSTSALNQHFKKDFDQDCFRHHHYHHHHHHYHHHYLLQVSAAPVRITDRLKSNIWEKPKHLFCGFTASSLLVTTAALKRK